MTIVISTINLKGGVGKTTTTVALAEVLAGEMGKRVLVIDLDPQTNATTMLIGEEEWGRLNKKEHTLARLFADALAAPADRTFNLDQTLQRGVSNIPSIKSLDLLPSSLELIDIQDRLGTMTSGPFFSEVPTDILRRAVRPILDEYDIVLIDCPPNLGLITLNGLRISTGYVIPTIPDILSTYGIDQIITRVKRFADNVGDRIEPLGIVISHFRVQTTLHKATYKRLVDRNNPRVFETVIPTRTDLAEAAEFLQPVATLRQKYGPSVELYRSLAEEIWEAAS